jgi:hypothetical protein
MNWQDGQAAAGEQRSNGGGTAAAAAASAVLDCCVDEQSQRKLSLGSKVSPAKKENMRRRSNSPKCVSWASPSKVSGKKIRNDTQELIRSENMDRRRALVPSH